ncbi:MAG: hypothetical protein OMM_04027 [Candidatus Magnetoglobus multicellularis str. Araruama]|uniref:Flagellar Assembly Protein A N-terminal region domain-containing protein n=1 Tax=Candidatus Magnetoglobus multicellularis str. Araruama TaxID=890399 RepID=A0A1V1P3H3_9BACT|nr:MAG: hypothetical protein OMM_04027 [Candidatus Magnetoglobus multicellularis str. Araruama]
METSESKKTGVHTVNDGKMAEIVKLDKRFGRIAIKNKLLTIEQVKDALRKQDYIYKKSNYIVLIGDLLVDSGAMNVRYRDAILKRQNRLITDKKKRKSFGEIAVEKGFITPEQLESALKYQAEKYSERRNVIFLGDVLLEQELISEEQRDIVAKEREAYRESTQAKTEIISPKEVSEPDTKKQMPKTPDQDETPEAETKTDKTSRQDEAAETKSQADKTPDQDETNKTAAPQPNKTPDQDEPIKISPQPDPTPDQDESSKTTPQTDETPEQDEIDDVSEQTAHKTEIVEEEEEEEETGEPYTDLNLEENLQISMTEDKLEAFIKVKAMLPIRTRLLDLKHYIESSGIVHGLVTNKSLKEWIKNKKKRRRPFKIAQGTNPEPPKDARVVFHFETDPKKKEQKKKMVP